MGVWGERGALLCLNLWLLLCLTGCGQSQEEIVLGMNLELSGALAQYGTECLQGAELAMDELEGEGDCPPFRLAVVDNRSENSDSVLGFLRLTQWEKAVCVIGPTTSNSVKAQLLQNSPVPVIVPTATSNTLDDPLFSNRYRICFTDKAQGEAMGEYAWNRGYRRVAILRDLSSDYSQGTSQAFQERFVALGGEIPLELTYLSGDMDFSVLLTQLASCHPQGVFLPAYDTQAGLIIRQARKMGYDWAFFSGDTFDSPVLEELGSDGSHPLDRVSFTNHYDPQDERLRDFALAYEEKFGAFPSAYAALGYDSVMLFAHALSQCSEVTPQAVSRALAQTRDWPGITGDITFDGKGNADKTPIVNGIVQGERRILQERGG